MLFARVFNVLIFIHSIWNVCFRSNEQFFYCSPTHFTKHLRIFD